MANTFSTSRTLIISLAIAVVIALAGSAFQFPVLDHISLAFGVVIGGLASVAIHQLGGASASGSSELATLYVGNLPYRANEGDVRRLFEQHGSVRSVRLLKDKKTGKRRGFGFVEVGKADAQKMISTLNDSEFQRRNLKVTLAKSQQTGDDDDDKHDE